MVFGWVLAWEAELWSLRMSRCSGNIASEGGDDYSVN